MDYRREYEQCQDLVEKRLAQFFTESCDQKVLLDAMRYSLLAGGKRIRPVLTMKFCQAAGGMPEEALDFACGVEMLHTYSLIHDDLPCMDNDDLRRGKPTCHKVYGETTAVLAGDALQAAAFRTVLSAKGPWLRSYEDGPGAAARILADAASERGMCGGQYLDTFQENAARSEQEMLTIHSGKTGALLCAACVMGVCASAGRREVNPEAFAAAKEYALHLGIAFQIQDDILDETATTAVLGKPVGSDKANQKTTYVTLLGVPECRRLVAEHTEQAKLAIRGVFADDGFLCWLADYLSDRNK